MEIPNVYVRNLYRAALTLLVILSLFLIIKALSEIKAYREIGSLETNTISFNGHGEVSAVPDIANVYFTIRKEAKTVKEAQDGVAVIEKEALDSLKTNDIDEKDIKTSNASFNPTYEYRTTNMVPCGIYGCPPSSGKNVISGYEAYESITLKVRDTDNVGKIMQELGALGVSELNGPNFSIDEEESLKGEARKMAIDDARAKAEVLAKDLGVRLGDIASFSESGDYPMPMYYAKDAMMVESSAGNAAQLPKGENTISSDVTITYKIR